MATKAKPAVTQSGKVVYINNRELLEEIKRCKVTGQMSNKLAQMLQLLCKRYAKKGCYVNYSYNEDMQAYAMMMLVRTWNGFNPEKSSNPFAFFTQCVKHSFLQYLKQESNQQDIRDQLLISQGLNPSYGYDDEGGRSNSIDDEQDFESIRRAAEAQERHRFIDTPIERDDSGVEIVVEPPSADVDGHDAEEPSEEV